MCHEPFYVSVRIHQQRPDSPEPNVVSMKSSQSITWPVTFNDEKHSADKMYELHMFLHVTCCVSMFYIMFMCLWGLLSKSVCFLLNRVQPLTGSIRNKDSEVLSVQSAHNNQTNLDSVFKVRQPLMSTTHCISSDRPWKSRSALC